MYLFTAKRNCVMITWVNSLAKPVLWWVTVPAPMERAFFCLVDSWLKPYVTHQVLQRTIEIAQEAEKQPFYQILCGKKYLDRG